MKKDYYANEIEKLNENKKVIDYIILVRDESLLTEVFTLGSTIKQVVIALAENESLVFIEISFGGKFKLLSNISNCKISKEQGYSKLNITNCEKLNGVYSVKAKLKSSKYQKEDLIDIICKEVKHHS